MTSESITTIIIALIAALPPTILAYDTLRKSQQLEVKSDKIHTLVNSNLSEVKHELATANKQIVDLAESIRATSGKGKGA